MAPAPATIPKSELPLLGLSLPDLVAWAESHGQSKYRGKQLHQWLYQRGIRNLNEISVWPKQWRAELAEVPVGRSTIHKRAIATDGTIKYLLTLSDGQIIEAVGIPTAQRLTVCISSQVGCPMACTFCATGKGGWQRNLLCHEIVDQVLTVQEDFQRRVSHIVFMGMGEPLLNIPQVIKAIRIFNQDIGISQRNMTVSTVGIPGKIETLAELASAELNVNSGVLSGDPQQATPQFTLAISLHASNQSIREQLIPSARHYPLPKLIEECRDYVARTRRRITFEYILLAGFNDQPEHAAELAQLLRNFQSHVNLIPYNPIQEADYQRPTRRQVNSFAHYLKQRRIAVSVRYSKGLDANAACGQLRAQHKQTA